MLLKDQEIKRQNEYGLFQSVSVLYVKDMAMLQSAFRGHLSREALLKHLLEDLQNKVSYTHTHTH